MKTKRINPLVGGVIDLIRNRVIKWVLVVLCLATMFFLSNMDSVSSWYLTGNTLAVIENTTDQTEGMTYDEKISHYSAQETQMLILRKIAHMTEYFGLSLLVFNALYRKKKISRISIEVELFCLVYAIFDEFHQVFVPGRTPTIHDVLIDACGALIGILVARWIRKTLPKIHWWGLDRKFSGSVE